MISVLLVEDEPMVRLLTKEKLSPSYHVLEAGDGEIALDVLDHEHVDLLIVDIQMPRLVNFLEYARTVFVPNAPKFTADLK